MRLGGELDYETREKYRKTILDTLVKDYESRNGGEAWLYHPKYTHLLISSKGKIYNIHSNVTYKQGTTPQGYKRISMYKDYPIKDYNSRITCSVHRLVAETYFRYVDLNRYEVNHINGDKSDNSVYNLNWLTRQENLQHARDTGLFKRQLSKSNGRFRHSQGKINEMAEFKSLGFTYKEIAEAYGESISSVAHIIKRRGNL